MQNNNVWYLIIGGIIVLLLFSYLKSSTQSQTTFVLTKEGLYKGEYNAQSIWALQDVPFGNTLTKGDTFTMQLKWKNDLGYTVSGLQCYLSFINEQCVGEYINNCDSDFIYYDVGKSTSSDISAGNYYYMNFNIDTNDFNIDACEKNIYIYAECQPEGGYWESFFDDSYFAYTCVPPQQTCTDSDGSDYYSEGYTTGSLGLKYDICDGDTLIEQYCSGTSQVEERYSCTFGCSSGKCILAQNTCTDSDGGTSEYYYGFVSGLEAGNTYIKYDTCSGAQVLEYYCIDTTWNGVYINCPNGCADGKCNGACTPNCIGRNCGDNGCGGSCGSCSGGQTCSLGVCINPTSCTDTDGDNLLTKGDVTYLGLQYTDYCVNTNTVAERICYNNQMVEFEASCTDTFGSGYACLGGRCYSTCTAESNSAFCSRLGKNCGAVTSADNCGTSRTVASCGTCTTGQTCQNNVCTTSITCGPADTDGTYGISFNELVTYAGKWKNKQGVTFTDLISVAGKWKTKTC